MSGYLLLNHSIRLDIKSMRFVAGALEIEGGVVVGKRFSVEAGPAVVEVYGADDVRWATLGVELTEAEARFRRGDYFTFILSVTSDR